MTDQIETLDAPEVEPTTARRKKASATADEITRVDSKSAKKVKIMIPKTKDETSDVFVGVNGVGFLIKRGVAVDVPDFVVDALNNAVESKLDPDTGTYSDVPSYPVSILG